jgi:ketosteroid isomerase-like protein
MQASTPQALHDLWTDYFLKQDWDALIQLYEPNAVMMAAPDQVAHSHEEIVAIAQHFRGLATEFEMHSQKVLQTGNLALLYSHWKLTGTAPDGSPVNLTGQTTDVARQQADGCWLLVIDSPFGGANL